MTRLYSPALFDSAPGQLAQTRIALTGAGRGRLVSGLSKLVQQVGFLLLTRVDSVEGLPGIGASPLSELSQLTLSGDLAAVNAMLAETTGEIARQLSRLQSPATPDDERLAALELSATDYDRQSGYLQITVSLQSRAGDAAQYEITA